MSMQLRFHIVATLAFHFGICSSVQYIAFDTASASSVYTGGGDGFTAGHALSNGGSYWCSAGGHGAGQVVSWTGVLTTRRQAAGVQLSWAYSPSEIQILASPDGINFVEAACWRPSSQTDAAYVEHVMFDKSMPVRALTVVMRGPRAWGYFALNSATLLAEPGPSMLVSGSTAPGGEMCAAAAAGGVALVPCIEAVAAGTGNEVFSLGGDGVLASIGSPGDCAALVDGDVASGGVVGLVPCRIARQSDDGRSIFHATGDGQLRIALGNNCVVARGTGLAVQDCEAAGQSGNAADKFFFTAVPQFDPKFAEAARAAAELAINTAGRLEGLLGQLDAASCVHLSAQKPLEGQHLHSNQKISSKSNASAHDASVDSAVESMIGQLKVGGLADVVAKARAALAGASSKM